MRTRAIHLAQLFVARKNSDVDYLYPVLYSLRNFFDTLCVHITRDKNARINAFVHDTLQLNNR